MQRISNRAYVLPVALGIFICLLNIQWMNLYLLINAPQADSLVYMTEAYNDYWAIRSLNLSSLFDKYITAGNQITSPLLWGITAIYFLFFGLDPQGAYIVIATFYLLWICGIINLAWTLYPDRSYAIACGLLAALLPSASSFGLRHYMLDFVAAAPFIWSTAFLIKSDLLNKRKDAVIYSMLVGITILFRTTAVIYFASHFAILLFQCISKKRYPDFKNIGIVILIGALSTGWFLAPNYKRIISYYTYWATQANQTLPANSFLDNLLFYFYLLKSFHFLNPGFAVLSTISIVGLVIFLIKFGYMRESRSQLLQVVRPSVIIIFLFAIPTAALSLYSSRAPSVDFPFVGAYLLVPLLFWAAVFPKGKYFWIPAVLLMIVFASAQFRILIKSNGMQDFREREVLRMILSDADSRGLSNITLGNTAIHQHNSLSYQYWTLANYFPKWTKRVNLVAIGRTDSAPELAQMNKDASYVITLENYNDGNWHPNNIVAPEANRILQDRYGMRFLPDSFYLPDGTIAKVLVQPVSITLPPAMSDGWHQNNVPIKIEHTNNKGVKLRISADLMNAGKVNDNIVISLKSKLEPRKVLSLRMPKNRIDDVFLIPANFFIKNSSTEFELSSSSAGNAVINGVISDRRNLAFRNLTVAEVSSD